MRCGGLKFDGPLMMVEGGRINFEVREVSEER
jgi:hypothetical protein